MGCCGWNEECIWEMHAAAMATKSGIAVEIWCGAGYTTNNYFHNGRSCPLFTKIHQTEINPYNQYNHLFQYNAPKMIDPELRKWVKENIPRTIIKSERRDQPNVELTFYNEEDAILFKLRWG